MSFFVGNRVVAGIAGVAMSVVVVSQAAAGPMFATPSQDLGIKSHITEVRNAPRRGGGGNAAAAAMLGLFAAGVGAAIANSQREEVYPSYGYGYGYGYAPAPVYAEPPAYYYDQQPYGYYRHPNDVPRALQRERDRRDAESR